MIRYPSSLHLHSQFWHILARHNYLSEYSLLRLKFLDYKEATWSWKTKTSWLGIVPLQEINQNILNWSTSSYLLIVQTTPLFKHEKGTVDNKTGMDLVHWTKKDAVAIALVSRVLHCPTHICIYKIGFLHAAFNLRGYQLPFQILRKIYIILECQQ